MNIIVAILYSDKVLSTYTGFCALLHINIHTPNYHRVVTTHSGRPRGLFYSLPPSLPDNLPKWYDDRGTTPNG